MIPADQCHDRHVYRVHARNFSIGVFVADNGGFIGIRTKFDSRYLFTEFHHEVSPTFGTVRPLEDLGELDAAKVPYLWERYPQSRCMHCGERVVYDENKEIGERWEHRYVPDLPAVDCNKPQSMGGGTYWPLFHALDDEEYVT